MKKKGFTLSEVLIAVSIIGVMAAIMASAFNHAKPDKAKMLYLKAYDALTTAVGAMVNDSTLFAESYEETVGSDVHEYNIEYTPLFDTSQPTNPYYYNDEFLTPPGNFKFARILCLMLKGKDSYHTQGNSATFSTGPGHMEWTVTPNITALTPEASTAQATFVVDLKIDNDDDRVFRFCIQPNGEVQATDARGKRYIANRTSVHDTGNSESASACTAHEFQVITNGTTHIVNDD